MLSDQTFWRERNNNLLSRGRWYILRGGKYISSSLPLHHDFDEDMFKERGGIFEWTRTRDEK